MGNKQRGKAAEPAMPPSAPVLRAARSSQARRIREGASKASKTARPPLPGFRLRLRYLDVADLSARIVDLPNPGGPSGWTEASTLDELHDAARSVLVASLPDARRRKLEALVRSVASLPQPNRTIQLTLMLPTKWTTGDTADFKPIPLRCHASDTFENFRARVHLACLKDAGAVDFDSTVLKPKNLRIVCDHRQREEMCPEMFSEKVFVVFRLGTFLVAEVDAALRAEPCTLMCDSKRLRVGSAGPTARHEGAEAATLGSSKIGPGSIVTVIRAASLGAQRQKRSLRQFTVWIRGPVLTHNRAVPCLVHRDLKFVTFVKSACQAIQRAMPGYSSGDHNSNNGDALLKKMCPGMVGIELTPQFGRYKGVALRENQGPARREDATLRDLGAVQNCEFLCSPVVRRESSGDHGRYEITVKLLTGKVLCFKVHSDATSIGDLKNMIQDREGYPPRQQRLIFCGMNLAVQRTMRDYNIKEGAILHCVLRTDGIASAHDVEFKICIKTLNGTNFFFGVNSKTTVGDLKRMILDKKGIPPHQQRLIFRGRVLTEDGRTLAEYSIEGSALIMLVKRMR